MKDHIINRIKKLKAHAESAKAIGSLEEAESFLLKAVELMNEYNVSEFEVTSHQEEEQDKFKNWGYSESISFDDKHQGWQWKKDLMHVLCKYNFTSFTFHQQSKKLWVHGNMENVDMTVWLYHFLEIGLYNLAEQHYQKVLSTKVGEDRRYFSRVEAYTFKRDFLIGAVEGFDSQLYEQRKANNKITAVVLYNDKALSEFLYKTKPHVKTASPRKETQTKHWGAAEAGYKAGKNFKVNKPLQN